MARDAVLFANEAFYRAFADRDIAAMEETWASEAPVACIHPGWSPVIGRERVLASWRAILANPASPAISCRRPQAFIHGDSAFVICYEEIEGAVLIATNLFVREGRSWKMTHHQAGPVATPSEEEERSCRTRSTNREPRFIERWPVPPPWNHRKGLGIMLRETSHAERGRAWAKMEQSGRMPRIFAYLGRLGGLAVLALLLAAGSARADYQSGLTAFDAGDFRKAAAEWQASAEQGDARSQHGLGLLYDSGRGFPENPKLAAEWYSKAAAQGVTAAASNLALLYATGRGVQKNLPKAVQLWDFAAKGGYATAQFNLGLLYYRGDGVAKSYPTAAAWFLKAAQGGSDDGAYAVAEMYRLGRGVPKDTKKAIFWFSQSARNGNTAAADRLAVLGAPAVAPAPPRPPRRRPWLRPPRSPRPPPRRRLRHPRPAVRPSVRT